MAYSQHQQGHRYQPRQRRVMNTPENMGAGHPIIPVSSQMSMRPFMGVIQPGQGGRMPLLAANQPLQTLMQPPALQHGMPPAMTTVHPSPFPPQNFQIPGGFRVPLNPTFPPGAGGLPQLPINAPPPFSAATALGQPSQIIGVGGRGPPPMGGPGGVGGGGAGAPPKKKVSRAIKIVDPDTKKEVDLFGSGGASGEGGNQAPRSLSPSPNAPRPAVVDSQNAATKELFRKQVHQTINPGGPPAPMVAPNAIISAPPPHHTYTPKAPPIRPMFEDPSTQPIRPPLPPSTVPHAPNPLAVSFNPGRVAPPQVAATGQFTSHHRPPDLTPPSQPPPFGTGLLATPNLGASHITANGVPSLPPQAEKTLPNLAGVRSDHFPPHPPPFTGVSDVPKPLGVMPVLQTGGTQLFAATGSKSLHQLPHHVEATLAVTPQKPVPELSQQAVAMVNPGVKPIPGGVVMPAESAEYPHQKQPLLPTPLSGLPSGLAPSQPVSSQEHLLTTTPTVMSSIVVPETGESAKSDDVTPPISLITKETDIVKDPLPTVSTETAATATVSTETAAADKTVTKSVTPEPLTSSVAVETVTKETTAVETKNTVDLVENVEKGGEGVVKIPTNDSSSPADVDEKASVVESQFEAEKQEEDSNNGSKEVEKEEVDGVEGPPGVGKTDREGGGEEREGEGEREEEVVGEEEVKQGEMEDTLQKDTGKEEKKEEEEEEKEEGEKEGEVGEEVGGEVAEKVAEKEEKVVAVDVEEEKEKEKEEEEEKEEEVREEKEEGELDEEEEEDVAVAAPKVVEETVEEERTTFLPFEKKPEVAAETKPVSSLRPQDHHHHHHHQRSSSDTTAALRSSVVSKKDPKLSPSSGAPVPTTTTTTAKPRPPVKEASPGATGGRTIYGRDFLLSFKDHAVCKEPPPNLSRHHDCFRTQQEIARDRERERERELSRGSMRQDMMYPFGHGGDRGDRGGGRGRDRGRRDPPPKVIRIDHKPVELHKAEQRWVPAKEVLKDMSEEEKATAELYRKFQAILNKLTPQKFQALAEQALQLKIDTEERLKGVIDKIFTKALEEPNFSIAYANLCKVLSPLKVEVTVDGKTKFTTFRRVLLTKCQQEFEKDKRDDEEREEMLSAIQNAETEERKKELEAELKDKETRARKRSLGNIRFIGELFKLKMLSETIMHECMIRLLKSSSDEESLECFAGLITTTGRDLDIPEAKPRIDGYFTRIQTIIAKGKISARIRFMLQDVLELRRNKWVPRSRQSTSLKTIDQIHAEAKAEEQRTIQMVAQHQMTSQFKPPMRGDDKRGRRENKGVGDDWQKVGDEKRGRRDEKPAKVDPKRITSLLRRDRGDRSKDAPLGPQGGMLRPGWNQKGPQLVQDTSSSSSSSSSASGGGGGVKGEKEKSTKPLRSSSGGQKRGERGERGEREKGMGGGRGLPSKRSSSREMSKERESAIRAVRSQTSAEAKPHPQPPVSKATPPPPTTPNPPVDEEVITRKTNTIVNELLENKDFKEAIECVKEMKCRPQLHIFVREAINAVLERSDSHRLLASQLLRDLLKDGELTKDKFREGLQETLEYAEDIEIDIPKFWDYMAQLLTHPVSDPSLIPLSLVTSLIPAPLVTKGKVGVLATKVMKQLTAGVCAESAVVALWQGLRWEEMGVKHDDLRELIVREQLEFLLEKEVLSSQSSSILNKLISRFRAIDMTNDDIYSWLEENCESDCRTAGFIRMLSTALLQAFVSGHGKVASFAAEDFCRRSVVLKRFADSHKQLHIHILYAFQSGVHQLEHPPELLGKIFHILYEDLEIVDESTFLEWRDRGTEQLGKGNAVHSLADFFQWLENANPESDTES